MDSGYPTAEGPSLSVPWCSDCPLQGRQPPCCWEPRLAPRRRLLNGTTACPARPAARGGGSVSPGLSPCSSGLPAEAQGYSSVAPSARDMVSYKLALASKARPQATSFFFTGFQLTLLCGAAPDTSHSHPRGWIFYHSSFSLGPLQLYQGATRGICGLSESSPPSRSHPTYFVPLPSHSFFFLRKNFIIFYYLFFEIYVF